MVSFNSVTPCFVSVIAITVGMVFLNGVGFLFYNYDFVTVDFQLCNICKQSTGRLA